MTIRKLGSHTGDVTGTEEDGITREAALPRWGPGEDEGLAEENRTADEVPGDDD